MFTKVFPSPLQHRHGLPRLVVSDSDLLVFSDTTSYNRIALSGFSKDFKFPLVATAADTQEETHLIVAYSTNYTGKIERSQLNPKINASFC